MTPRSSRVAMPRCCMAPAQPLPCSLLMLLLLPALAWLTLSSTLLVNAQPVPELPSRCLSGATPFTIADHCAQGFHCPLFNASSPSTFPVQCPPTNDCMLRRLTFRFCEAQGTYEPTVCEAGFYCPSPHEQLHCPEGHICPRGQFKPIPCGPLSICPAGSIKEADMSSLLAMLLVDLSLVALCLSALAWRRRQWALRDQTYAQVQTEASVHPSLYRRGAAYAELPAHSQLLCQGFKRAQQSLPLMRVEFSGLALTIPAKLRLDKKPLPILKGVTGSLEPGRVTAIMGPSGAGKTTFLHSLLSQVDPSWERSGSLRVNGADESSLSRFRPIIGFVPQEDCLHADLSVADNISYSASVRLPSSWTRKQREDHVHATIAAMQLTHVQDALIGDEARRGVSGGQKKRCNIGVEVAAAPGMLLLDEPTSGLDSTSALEICGVLRDLARVSSITVVLVVHQPRVEIWNSLDELLLLAPGGLSVYQGPQRLAAAYFQRRFDVQLSASDNPADGLMDRIAEQADEFVAGWVNGGPEYVAQLRDEARQTGGKEQMMDSPPVIVPQEEEGSTDSQQQQHQSELPRMVSSVPAAAGAPLSPRLSVLPSAAASPSAMSPSPQSPPQPSASSAAVSSAAGQVLINIAPRVASPPSYGAATDAVGEADTGAAAADPSRDSPPLRSYASSRLLPAAYSDSAPLRLTAGFLTQVRLSFVRSLWKQLANPRTLYLEIGLGLLAGGTMGAMMKLVYQGVLLPPYTLLSPAPMDGIIGGFMFNVGLAISLAAVSAGVAVFGEEQLLYRREVSSGASHLAYYLGVNLAQLPRLFVDGLHFAAIFHILCKPLTSFGELMAIAALLYTAIYGLSFICSQLVSRKNAPLLGVVLSLTFSSMTQKGGQPEAIQYFSASRWGAEALFTRETEPYTHIYDVAGVAERSGYVTGRVGVDLAMMIVVGVVYRLVAYALMRWADRRIIRKQ